MVSRIIQLVTVSTILVYSPFGFAKDIRIGVLLIKPGTFSITPAVDHNNGDTISQTWIPRGESIQNYSHAYRFDSFPPGHGESAEQQVEMFKKGFEGKGCTVTVKVGSAPILGKAKKPTGSKTKEKFLYFKCKESVLNPGKKNENGVMRFIQGDLAIFIIAYYAYDTAPKIITQEGMDKVVREAEVVLHDDWKFLNR